MNIEVTPFSEIKRIAYYTAVLVNAGWKYDEVEEFWIHPEGKTKHYSYVKSCRDSHGHFYKDVEEDLNRWNIEEAFYMVTGSEDEETEK